MKKLNELEFGTLLFLLFNNSKDCITQPDGKRAIIVGEGYNFNLKRILILTIPLLVKDQNLPIELSLNYSKRTEKFINELSENGLSKIFKTYTDSRYFVNYDIENLSLENIKEIYQNRKNCSYFLHTPFLGFFYDTLDLTILVDDYQNLLKKLNQFVPQESFKPYKFYNFDDIFYNFKGYGYSEKIQYRNFSAENNLLLLLQMHTEGVIKIIDFDADSLHMNPIYGDSFTWSVKFDINDDLIFEEKSAKAKINRTESYYFYGPLGINDSKGLICYKFFPPISQQDTRDFQLLNLLLSENKLFYYKDICINLDLVPDVEDVESVRKAAQDVKRELNKTLRSLGFSDFDIEKHLQNRNGGYIFIR